MLGRAMVVRLMDRISGSKRYREQVRVSVTKRRSHTLHVHPNQIKGFVRMWTRRASLKTSLALAEAFRQNLDLALACLITRTQPSLISVPYQGSEQ
jgi:KaiC/GvpD/RAD55 family RecA-like ATPase